MSSRVFRTVHRWQGPATIGREERVYAVEVSVYVVAELTTGADAPEIDTGNRTWTATVTGLPKMVTGDVIVRLSGGRPTTAKVTASGRLLGLGVPPPLDQDPG